MNLIYNFTLEESDDIEMLLRMLNMDNNDSKITNEHHENPDFCHVFQDEITIEFYTFRLYKNLCDIHQDMLEFMRRCENLKLCNDILKQHLNRAEAENRITHLRKPEPHSRFTVHEFGPEDEYLFND